MHYVRTISNPRHLFDSDKNDLDRAKLFFLKTTERAAGLDSISASVFEAADASEETRVRVGSNIRSSDKPKRLHSLRIGTDEIAAAGLELISTSDAGYTGIKSIDALHYSLNGEVHQFEALCKMLRERSLSGEDLIRVVWMPVVICQLERFLDLPEEEISAEARDRCRAKLGRSADTESQEWQ